MNRNNEISIFAADAFVMYYDSMLNKWIASGGTKSVTISNVQVLQNAISNQFKIFACNPNNKEVLVNSILYHNLRYQKAHSTFHEWRDADTQLVYGLHFADTKDASIFGDVIAIVFKSLQVIYQQFRELQSQIRAISLNDQTLLCNEHVNRTSDLLIRDSMKNSKKHRCNKENQSYSNVDPMKLEPRNRVKSPPLHSLDKCYATLSYAPNFDNNQLEVESLHDYENIESILVTHNIQEVYGKEHVQLSNKCQSSSDDSVYGLRKQISSSSSGYATVASLSDQVSGTTGVTSSFAVVLESSNKYVLEAKSNNPTTSYQSTGLRTDSAENEVLPSTLASQLHTIQLRTVKKTGRLNDASINLSFPQYNTKYDIGLRASEDLHVPPPPDDLMTEMKLKLQRRMQLIDGHTDTSNSSSTDKSEVCSNDTSDIASFVGLIEHSTDKVLLQNKLRYDSNDEKCKTRINGIVKPNKFLEDLKDSSINKLYASKCDLYQIQKEIIEGFRKDFIGIKKEVIDAIRLLKMVL